MNGFFDNASTSRVDERVVHLMSGILAENYGNPSSIHKAGREARIIIEQARKKIAKLTNASLGEIFFTSSASEANNTILKNAVTEAGVQRFISTPTEHPCVLNTLKYLSDKKLANVILLDVDKYGRINLTQLEDLLKESSQKTLVSIMYANNEIGTIHPLPRISELCQQYSALLHCDAVQYIGKYPLDLQELKLDYLSATAHKFHGPKGAAFFYMNSNSILPPYIHGGSQERNMRAGTENVSGIAGLAVAFELAANEMEQRKLYVGNLRKYFEHQLSTLVKDIYFNHPEEESEFLYNISSVSFPSNSKTDMMVMNLDIAGFCVSSASACSSGIEEDSHVMKAIGHPSDRNAVRFSFSKYNTEEEIDALIKAIIKSC